MVLVLVLVLVLGVRFRGLMVRCAGMCRKLSALLCAAVVVVLMVLPFFGGRFVLGCSCCWLW